MNYRNRYWEVGEQNKFGRECYKLHFIEYYDDEVIISFVQDEEDEHIWIYTSKLLNVEYDDFYADDVEEAKLLCEAMIVEHWEDEINRLENAIVTFNEHGALNDD